MASEQHTAEQASMERIQFGAEKMPVHLTMGFITEIRIDLGYYQAKVASLRTPSHHRQGNYMLGAELDEKGELIAPGAWIQFMYPADYLVENWVPQPGDRVMVLTFGSYEYEDARILQLTTSDKREAEAAGELTINGRSRLLSGGPSVI